MEEQHWGGYGRVVSGHRGGSDCRGGYGGGHGGRGAVINKKYFDLRHVTSILDLVDM